MRDFLAHEWGTRFFLAESYRLEAASQAAFPAPTDRTRNRFI
jgi:hypothetical protein